VSPAKRGRAAALIAAFVAVVGALGAAIAIWYLRG
jgi:hypothetical protein